MLGIAFRAMLKYTRALVLGKGLGFLWIEEILPAASKARATDGANFFMHPDTYCRFYDFKVAMGPVPASFFRLDIFIDWTVPANLAVPNFKSFMISIHKTW
eukprot:SAG11_NODE_135_length_15131_cov_9.906599_6_plen_101_part_00